VTLVEDDVVPNKLSAVRRLAERLPLGDDQAVRRNAHASPQHALLEHLVVGRRKEHRQ